MCVAMRNFVKIGQTVVKILQFSDFQDGGHRPSSIFKTTDF